MKKSLIVAASIVGLFASAVAAGTTNRVPKWTSPYWIGNSIMEDDGSTVTVRGNLTSTNTVKAPAFDSPNLQSYIASDMPVGIVVSTQAGRLIPFSETRDDLGEFNGSTYTATNAGIVVVTAYGTALDDQIEAISGDQLQMTLLKNGVAVATFTSVAEDTAPSWDLSNNVTVAAGDTLTIFAEVLAGPNSFTIDTDSVFEIVGPENKITFKAGGVEVASASATGFFGQGFYGKPPTGDSVVALYTLGVHSNEAALLQAHLGRGSLDLTNGAGATTVQLVGQTGALVGSLSTVSTATVKNSIIVGGTEAYLGGAAIFKDAGGNDKIYINATEGVSAIGVWGNNDANYVTIDNNSILMSTTSAVPFAYAGYSAFFSSGAVSAEMWVMDGAGNATQISPHDPETGRWRFLSCNDKTGRCYEVPDMERLINVVEKLSGERLHKEWSR